MKKRKILVGLLAFSALLSVSSCKKDDNTDNNGDNTQDSGNTGETEITVTLNSLGGTELQTSVINGYVVEPAEPKKDGVYFVQWCTDEACTTPFDFSKPITESVTLYAQWRNPYDFVCNYYVGDTIFTTTTTKEDTKLVKPTTNPEHPTNPLYMEFDAWHTEKDESKQNSQTKWNDTEVVTGEVNLYASFKNREAGIKISYGAEQIAAIKNTDDIEYKNFYFKGQEGIVQKKNEDCIKSGGNTLITVEETARLTVRVGSGSSNTTKQWVALIKAKEFDQDTFNVTDGVCMTPTNAKEENIAVSEDGKITIMSANSGFSTLIFEGLEPGKYVLTAGSSNSFIQDSTADRGTSCIPEIKLEMVRPLTPIDKIALSAACPEYHILAGRELDLSGVLLNAEFENGAIDPIYLEEALKDQTIYGEEAQKPALVFDDSQVDLDTAGTYTVGVKYTNPYDGEEYELEGGITVKVYETESLKFGDYSINDKGLTVKAPKVFVSEKFSSSNLVVIGVAKSGEDTKEFVLKSTEFEVQPISALTKGENEVTVVSGTVSATYNVQYVDKIAAVDGEVIISVDPAATTIGKVDENVASFNTITDALTFLKACELDDDVVKYIGLADGTYNEKIDIDIPNVVMGGTSEDATKVVITYGALSGTLDPSGSVAHGTNGCATVSIRPEAVGFRAGHLTIANDYNTYEEYKESLEITNDTQAVAALVQADQSAFGHVIFSGYHDTLFAQVGRQYYEDCYIEGRTDYIFGYNATALFKNCTIHTIGAYKMVDGNKVFEDNGGYVLATKGNKSNTDTDGIEYGFVFDGCEFTAEEGVKAGSVALGRTWSNNMRIMIMNSELSAAYSTKAYTSTLNYGSRYTKMKSDAPNPELLLEYANTGEGAVTIDDQEDLIDTCTIIDTEDADMAALLAKYESSVTIFGAVNGKVKYDTPWNIPTIAKDASIKIVVVGLDSPVEIPYDNYGWIGSTVTNYQLNIEAEAAMPEGYEVAAFYKDAECTTVYDDTTVLAAENTIYLKLNKLGERTVANYLFSETNEGWTIADSLGSVSFANTIGATYDKNNAETKASTAKLSPAWTKADGTAVAASTLSYNVGSSPSVYLTIATGTGDTSNAGTLTVLGYDANGAIVATATGTTPKSKVTNYVVSTADGSTKLALKSTGAPIAKVVIMNNDSTAFQCADDKQRGIGVHSIEMVYFVPESNTVTDTYSFDWSKISTANLDAGTNVYTHDGNIDVYANAAYETPVAKYDSAVMATSNLLEAFGDTTLTNIKVIGDGTNNCGVLYRDGVKWWKTEEATSTNPECIELKGTTVGEHIGGIEVTFKGKGSITITWASTGKNNQSRLGLVDSEGKFVEASTLTPGEGALVAVTEGDEIGAYEAGASGVGTKLVTITFNITKAGTYTIVAPCTVRTRAARIFNMEIKDSYVPAE